MLSQTGVFSAGKVVVETNSLAPKFAPNSKCTHYTSRITQKSWLLRVSHGQGIGDVTPAGGAAGRDWRCGRMGCLHRGGLAREGVGLVLDVKVIGVLFEYFGRGCCFSFLFDSTLRQLPDVADTTAGEEVVEVGEFLGAEVFALDGDGYVSAFTGRCRRPARGCR